MRGKIFPSAFFLSFMTVAAMAQSPMQKAEKPYAWAPTPAHISATGGALQHMQHNGTAAMQQSARPKAEGSEVWLYDHMNRYQSNPRENEDYYYKHDDEGRLTQSHHVKLNSEGKYSHTYEWYTYVLGERRLERQICATNSSADDSASGVTSDTRLTISRTGKLLTLVATSYKDGSPTPHQETCMKYHYNDLGQVESYEEQFTDYDSEGKVTAERPSRTYTYEYGDDMRPCKLVFKDYTYTDEPYVLSTVNTTTISDIVYAGTANSAMPADVASPNWNGWMYGEGSNLTSYKAVADEDNKSFADKSKEYAYSVTFSCTQEGGTTRKRWNYDKREIGIYQTEDICFTDEWGSFTDEYSQYSVSAGQEPSDDNFTRKTVETLQYSSAEDYTHAYKYIEKESDGSTSEWSPYLTKYIADKHDNGNITRAYEDTSYYYPMSSDIMYTLSTIITYDGYHRAGEGESTGISSATADGGAPASVYNMQGMAVGTSAEGLPKGIYVVKKGAHSKKVAVK